MIDTVFGREQDILFMKEAIAQAYKAQEKNEVPIGAVVVDGSGNIIGCGFNQVEKDCTQRSHAESIAIEKAGVATGSWRLNNCWLYVTLEPCAMCMGLIQLSRLKGVVFAAPSPVFGFRLDKTDKDWVYKRDTFLTIEGVCQEEAAAILKDFFKKKRSSRD